MTSTMRLAAATVLFALLVAPLGCTARKPRAVSQPRPAASAKPSSLVHPPYDAGAGTITGTLLRSQVSTYPAGSTQRQVPFEALIITWTRNGEQGVSEFLINGFADLIDGGRVRRQVPANQIVKRVEAAGGASVTVDYAGSHLLPSFPVKPPGDFPYALVTTITVDAVP